MTARPMLRRLTILLAPVVFGLVCLHSTAVVGQEPPPPPEPPDSAASEDEPDSDSESDSDSDSESDSVSESSPVAPESESGDLPPPPPPLEDMDTEKDSDVADASANQTVQTQTRSGGATPVQRMALESLGGLGGMVGGYLGGALTGAVIAGLVSQDSYSVLIGAVIGGSAGYLVGTPMGIWAVGNSVGGNGNFWATFGGTTLGLVAAGALASATANANPQVSGTVGPAAALIIPIGGGILGYELTHSVRSDDRSSLDLRKPGFRWSAGAGPTRHGKGGLITFGASW